MNRIFCFICILSLFFISSCSANNPLVFPDRPEHLTTQNTSQNDVRTSLWGYYNCRIDLDKMAVTVNPVRHSQFTCNVVNWLNTSPLGIQFEINSAVDEGPYTGIDIDITHTHPFPGLPKFNGYDVRGVFIGDGSQTLKNDSVLASVSGSDQFMMDNPATGHGGADGYTRWFNPTEFSEGGLPLFNYTQGSIASSDYFGTAALNPYKYFMDGLEAGEAAWDWLDLHADQHGVFSSGVSNTRNYYIRFPEPTNMRFGYAVTANWSGPDVNDHPSNTPEAILCSVIDNSNVMYNGPGDFSGSINIDFSLFNWTQQPSNILIESTVLADPYELDSTEMIPIGGNENYSTWHVEIPANAPNFSAVYEYWIIAEYGGFTYANDVGVPNLAQDENLKAYFRYDLDVPGTSLNLMWAKSAGSIETDTAQGVTTLSDDSIVVTGFFKETTIFGKGETNETVMTSEGLFDIFVAKYNPDGELIWAKSAGGTDSYDRGFSVTGLSDDSVVVTGCYNGPATFSKGEPCETVLCGVNYGSDIFIARYSPDGTLMWVTAITGWGFDLGYSVTALPDNSIVLTGQFQHSTTFGEGEANETVFEGSDNNDVFLARYDQNGLLMWATAAQGYYNDIGYAVSLLSDNSIAVAGYFRDSLTFAEGEPGESTLQSAGDTDFFLACYASDSIFLWAVRAGGEEDEQHLEEPDITVLSDDSIVTTGYFESTAVFGEGEPNETVLTSKGYRDIFLARFDQNGNLLWAKSAGGSGSSDYGYSVAALSGDLIALTGYFGNTAVFGEGEINQTYLTSPEYSNAFFAYYNPDGTLVRVKSAGVLSYCHGNAVAALSDDSIVVAGSFSTAAIFGQGEPFETLLNSEGQGDIFIARFYP